MPPPLPERFRLEVRLGRDGDIEEWLATDNALDRPVLIRFLGPDSEQTRRRSFVEAVQAASKVGHPHLAAVYLVEEIEDGAYSVSEWTGGANLASRLKSGDTIDSDEFLPNAAGLYGALGALHDSGVVHGGIDLGAITYTVAHPAKLGSFGRKSRGATTHDDVRSMAEALEEGLTASPPGVSPPSELIDGLSTSVDEILRSGRRSAMGATALAEAFASAPTPRRAQPESTRPSRRLLLVAIGLVAAAAGLVGLGRLFTPDSLPVLPPPAVEAGDASPGSIPSLSTTTTTTLPANDDLTVSNPSTRDPFGEGGENDAEVDAIIDGDLATTWRTERYLDPLPLLKAGVGFSVDVEGVPRTLDLFGLDAGASIELMWGESSGEEPSDYEPVARLLSQPGATTMRLPPRTDGTWLIWFTDLPEADGNYVAEISEVRFTP